MAGLLHTGLIWIAYAVAVGLALIAAIITTLTWQAPRERSAVVSTVAIISITALLATVFLLPVDIALVSSTGMPALGAKKQWATPEHIDHILASLKIAYYLLYSFDALLCLIVIPFTYFWYEEYDEIDEEENGNKTFSSRLWGAFKYTFVFVVLVAALFLVGFFVPAAGGKGGGKHLDLDYFRKLLAENNGEKALTFSVGILVTLGTLLYVLYTGAGLALLPISFIKSAPSISAPQLSETTASAVERNRERQRQLEMRNAGRNGMTAKDRRELEALMREERTLVRRERLAAEASGEGHGWLFRAWNKVQIVLRPLKLLGGIFFLALSLLLVVSMIITGIDKAANSVCKQHCGYILGHINVFQPTNWIFMRAARAFPVDYILTTLLVLYFFSSSISGLAAIGIRFLWVRIFEIRKGHTAPQALLVATVMLSLMILAINYAVAMLVAPQYASFGTQTFCMNPPLHPGEQPNCTGHPDWIKPCSEAYEERAAKDVCTPTVMSTFLNRVTLNWPVFGAVDFWAQFAFLGVFLVVFATSLFRTPRLNLSAIDAEAEVDEEEGLLASTGRRFGATWQDLTGRTGGQRSSDRRDYGTTSNSS
ncbi:MAG: hypothetical protein SEPTF4163_003427 [Sporothrix epigloea]